MPKSLSYNDLMSQISKLSKQAEVVRKNESANLIKSIQNQIKAYGLTASDLGLETVSTNKVVHRRKKPVAKFKDPVSGATWTGRGKTPKWMQDSMKKGLTKEAFALNP